jgi:hypothetical protein
MASAASRPPAAARSRPDSWAARVEQRFLGDRAGRDQAHDLALHHRLAAALLRLGRVLDLLADRDAVAEP